MSKAYKSVIADVPVKNVKRTEMDGANPETCLQIMLGDTKNGGSYGRLYIPGTKASGGAMWLSEETRELFMKLEAAGVQVIDLRGRKVVKK